MAKYGKSHGPWWGNEVERLAFERNVAEHYPNVRRQTGSLGGDRAFVYRSTIVVPFYEARRVEIFFTRGRFRSSPIILADGSPSSPHRFSGFAGRRLCVWHPDDPAAERWVWEDGLLQLLSLTMLHLFREAWWRVTDEWLGPQTPHGITTDNLGEAS